MKNNPSLTEAEAKEIVLTYSAFPGTSEHQTGLCCDMHNLPSAGVAFANKEAYTWLKENCHKFGFIIRFPEDKTDITGYSFEPWHYRFVGRYHATRMYNLGMCLEEYVEHLAKANN
jgi:D-alanyl-D-alanine carboxypeptidase